MQYNPANPLIVQGDRTVLLEVDNPLYPQARDALAPFAELEKSPEHIHTYRLTPLSLWNAAAAGMSAEAMIEALSTFSKFPIPANVPVDIRELVSRYGRVRLKRVDGALRLVSSDATLLEELARQKGVRDYLGERVDPTSFAIDDAFRGVLKQGLIAVGYPAEDLAGYTSGADLAIGLRETTVSGHTWRVRDYQRQAVEAVHAGGDVRGGSGDRPRGRRQDDRRHRRDGGPGEEHAGPHHEHDQRRAARRSSTQGPTWTHPSSPSTRASRRRSRR